MLAPSLGMVASCRCEGTHGVLNSQLQMVLGLRCSHPMRWSALHLDSLTACHHLQEEVASGTCLSEAGGIQTWLVNIAGRSCEVEAKIFDVSQSCYHCPVQFADKLKGKGQ